MVGSVNLNWLHDDGLIWPLGVVVSYAGLAHIKSEPTDLWLLAEIAGKPLGPPVRPGAGPPMRFGGPLDLTLGRLSAALIRAIERDFLRESAENRAQHIEVMVVGWTWKRDARFGKSRPSTFARYITHDGRRGTPCKVTTSPRRWFQDPAPSRLGFSLDSIGSALLNDERVARLKARMTEPNSVMTAEEMESWIAGEIRLAAREPLGDTIGTELMSIRLVPNGPPVIQFLRDLALTRPNEAFTPAYITTAGCIIPPQRSNSRPPSFVTGTDELQWVVQVESVPPLPNISGLNRISSQDPRRWPESN